MKRFLWRYGTFVALTVFLLSVGMFAAHFPVRTKQAVTLVVDRAGQCRIYMPSRPDFATQRGDTLTLNLSVVGECAFRVEGFRAEPNATVVTALPLRQEAFMKQAEGNTLLVGTVFTGQKSMLSFLCERLLYTSF